MDDWKPNVLRGYLEICAYSYLLRFKCVGNTIPILSFTTDKISYCKKGYNHSDHDFCLCVAIVKESLCNQTNCF